MGLKNAFDNLGTESALRRIANLLTFARDSLDRPRVVVDSGSVTIYNRASSNNQAGQDGTSYYSAVTWNSVDAREPLRAQYRSNATYVRQTRWTIN